MYYRLKSCHYIKLSLALHVFNFNLRFVPQMTERTPRITRNSINFLVIMKTENMTRL